MELRKVKQHVDLVRSSKERITRSNTRANRNSSRGYYDEKQPHHHHHRRPHSVDRYSEYTRYEEKGSRRPRFDHGSHHNPHLGINTDKAQREYYYSHALPSPYRGEIEYTPLNAEFDDSRSHAGSERSSRRGRGGGGASHHHGGGGGDRKEEFVSRSSSVVDRGRTRSRSVHQERRVRDSSADADSEAEEVYERREYFPAKGGRSSGRHR